MALVDLPQCEKNQIHELTIKEFSTKNIEEKGTKKPSKQLFQGLIYVFVVHLRQGYGGRCSENEI